MMKNIFITGASGCIGHYIIEALTKAPENQLFLLIRNPEKLSIKYQENPQINLIIGDLNNLEPYQDLLGTMDMAILAATSWGGFEETYNINVTQTLKLLEILSNHRCEQIIYFSTASILNQKNQLLSEAGELGTNYIRTKYECYRQLSQLSSYSKTTILFPTLVLGGDENKPYSHLYAGLPDVLKLIKLIRWFRADGSFHFIHAQDIAQVVKYLVENPPQAEREFVLGNRRITVDEAVVEICDYLKEKIYFRIPLSMALANFFIKVFRLQMEAWDRFSLEYRHFTHQKTFTPASFGLENYCSTIADVLRLRGIKS